MARVVISTKEKLLLHLLEFDDHRDSPEVPLAVSQEGIAQRLGIQVHAVSRALSSLQSDGLAIGRLAHVRGAPKRRKTYFLTDQGHQAANAIRASLLETRVTLEDAGMTSELRLSELSERLDKSVKTISFLDLIMLASNEDILHLSSLIGRVAGHDKSCKCVSTGIGRPSAGKLFGRTDELTDLSHRLEDDATRCVLISGMAGIGKSSLGSTLFDNLIGKRHTFWYSLHTWDTEEHFLSILTEYLRSIGRSDTADSVSRGYSLGDLFTPLVADLSKSNAVIFLDDVHKSSEQLLAFLTILQDAMCASCSSKLVMMSRSTPDFFSRSSQSSYELELTVLDDASARKYAESIRANNPAAVVGMSGGHPLLLNLMSRGGNTGAAKDLTTFIEREVTATMSPAERGMLEMLSIFRHPVEPSAIIEKDDSELMGLKSKGLLVEQENGIWTHDFLRDFFRARLSLQARMSLHKKAASYCGEIGGVDWQLETLHHLVEAADWSRATLYALEHAIDIAYEFPGEALSLVSRMTPGDVDVQWTPEILHIRGQIREMNSDDAGAAEDYAEALKLAVDDELRANILENIGLLKSQMDEWNESFNAHQSALALYERTGNLSGQIREWLTLGGDFRTRREYERARDAYSRALSIASRKEDRPAQAACLNNLAMLDWDQGRMKDAEARLKESIGLAHAVKDHRGEAKGLENLAELLRAQRRVEEMTNLLHESAEAFRRADELIDYKRLLAACAESLGMQGLVADGIDLCRTAFERPEIRAKKGVFGRSPHDHGDAALSFALMSLYRGMGETKKGLVEADRLMNIAESLDDPSLRARGHVEVALFKEGMGDIDSAVDELKSAEQLLIKVGDREGLTAVRMIRARIAESLGDIECARGHYVEALRHAETSDNVDAVSLARDRIADLDNGGHDSSE